MSMSTDETHDAAMDESRTTWWVAGVGDTLVWARMEVLESGIAEVLESSGGILRYDDEDQARMALLDAEFRAFDGIDEDDAASMGFDLESVEPPRAESDEELVPQMITRLLRIQ